MTFEQEQRMERMDNEVACLLLVLVILTSLATFAAAIVTNTWTRSIYELDSGNAPL